MLVEGDKDPIGPEAIDSGEMQLIPKWPNVEQIHSKARPTD